MTEFSNLYKDGMRQIQVPDYSLEELSSLKRHKKYANRKKMEGMIALILFMAIFSAVASATAYAAYTIHIKSIKFTSNGVKIDSSDLESQSDRTFHEYTDTDTDTKAPVSYADIDAVPVYRQEDFNDEITVQKYVEINYFDNWADALKVIDFPIVYPETIQYSELKIAYQTDTSFKSVSASYSTGEKELVINYMYFLSRNWDFAVEYNAKIVNKYLYTNKYDYEFWITECRYEDGVETDNVVVYINDCVIQLSFSGYGSDEIYGILDGFDLG